VFKANVLALISYATKNVCNSSLVLNVLGCSSSMWAWELRVCSPHTWMIVVEGTKTVQLLCCVAILVIGDFFELRMLKYKYISLRVLVIFKTHSHC